MRKKANFLFRTLRTSEPGVLQSLQNELWEERKKGKEQRRAEKAADVWIYHLSGWRLGRAISAQQCHMQSPKPMEKNRRQ